MVHVGGLLIVILVIIVMFVFSNDFFNLLWMSQANVDLDVIRKNDVSAAIFAPGWVYETKQPWNVILVYVSKVTLFFFWWCAVHRVVEHGWEHDHGQNLSKTISHYQLSI